MKKCWYVRNFLFVWVEDFKFSLMLWCVVLNFIVMFNVIVAFFDVLGDELLSRVWMRYEISVLDGDELFWCIVCVCKYVLRMKVVCLFVKFFIGGVKFTFGNLCVVESTAAAMNIENFWLLCECVNLLRVVIMCVVLNVVCGCSL